MKIEQVVSFKSCLTCGYRRFYPPSSRNGKLEFYRFYCGNAGITGKAIVGPQEVCQHWKGATLRVE
ncbi:MAG: hypothetical protein JW856_02910 [Dehalococcoidales bacterium]|nr:hypothetical protein [Dehalococcoidales bacterium]